ncbi:ABC transporter substrate-binding protein [Variovorax sp. YR566]|uniref:ABC transporter substrate-binding protein n=1 Tax=Variovorax sp. YR566 TaxID=3450237 RepID=UPI003F7E0BCB
MTPSKFDSVKLQLKWLHQAQFAGYYVAQQQGFYNDERLNVEILVGGPGVDPEALVARGVAHFAQGGGVESLLACREQGMSIVAIGALFPKVDVAFIAKQEEAIRTLQDFSGRTVSTWYTGVHLILRALLIQSGVDLGRVNEVEQAATMRPFIEGDVSIAAATFYNQLPALRNSGMSDLVIFDPAEHGVVIPRDTFVTSESMIRHHPDIVLRFLRASLRGWKHAILHQENAVECVMTRGTKLDKRHQAVMMREIASLALWGGRSLESVGYVHPDAARFTSTFLHENQQTEIRVPADQACSMRFWEDVQMLP